jgi:hypothetical protein
MIYMNKFSWNRILLSLDGWGGEKASGIFLWVGLRYLYSEGKWNLESFG